MRYFNWFGGGVGLVSLGLFGIFAACSSDDTTAAPADGGKSDATTEAGGGDTGSPGCADAGSSSATCSITACTTQLGEPAACVNNACVKLKSADCPNVWGATTANNAILLGTVLPLTGANASSGLPRQNSVQLAVTEINTAGGVPFADQCTPARPILFVGCDDNTNPDAGVDRDRGGKHLLNDLGIPAIIGAGTSGNTLDLAVTVTVPGKAMLIAPSATAVALTTADASVDGVRLLWRTAPSDVIQSAALGLLVGEITQAITADGGTGNLKLAFISKSDAYGTGIDGALNANTTLKLNGAGIHDAANQNYFLDVCFNADPTQATTACDATHTLANAVTALQGFEPDIIVLTGTTEAVTGILIPYEGNLVGDAGVPDGGAAKKPHWLLPDGLRRTELTTYADTQPEVRTRIRGTVPGVVTPLAQDFFNLRYKTAFPDNPQLIFGMAGAYDATYLMAYSIAAIGTSPVTGEAIATNVSKLISGGNVDVGPSSLHTAFSTLLGGDKIDFNGASGPLNFDVTIGEAPSDITVWCLGVDPNTNLTLFNDTTGQEYNASQQQLTGTFACQ